jgi:hypothetical protein
MRKALVVIAGLAVLIVAADFGARLWSQHVVSRELASSFDLQEQPDVSIGGFPFLPKLVSGDLPSVTVEARGYSARGVRLDAVDLSLRDVHVATGQLLSGGDGTVRAAGGEGTARITAADATRALEEQGVPVTVRFEGGRILLGLEEVEGEVEAEASVEGGSVVFRPVDPSIPVSVSFPLPEVVPGMTYTDIRIDDDMAVLSFELDRLRFEVSPR